MSTKRSPASKDGGNGQALVIVESPAKAKTINKYLGSNFKVLASYGHVRDLPKRRRKGEQVAGVDIDAGWKPTYVVVEDKDEGSRSSRRRTAKDIIAELKREANKSSRIYLATDPDREGEAIAWHVKDELKLPDEQTFRIAFNEITRSAVQNAISHPGKLDMMRVNAQEARRILDRVVGYPLSNLLSRKIVRGSSAGRVQSVALRLVVDREREIERFRPEEYWKIIALLAPQGTVGIPRKDLEVILSPKKDADASEDESDSKKQSADSKANSAAKRKAEVPEGAFQAELIEWAGKKFDKDSQASDQTTVMAIAQALDTASYQVLKVEQKDRQEKPQPPFTTSTLQRLAFQRLHFTTTRTMQTAQKLYEGVQLGSEGLVALITYMRTDSTRVSDDALKAVRAHIQSQFPSEYLPSQPNSYASGKSAQEAHEAIRPTDVSYTPERVARLGLSGDQLRLYTLIYQRFVASQMTNAVFAITNVEMQATPQENPESFGLFKAQGKIMKFDGYRRVLPPPGKQEDALLPPLSVQQLLDRLGLTASQHFTQPPPRYNEASLVKALEKEGIGRPSTYAPIIQKITSERRGYIEVRERKFYATEIGKVVTDLLVEHFPRVMDLKFTSQMEEDLDRIAGGQIPYSHVLNEFWLPFSQALATAEAQMPSKRGEETGENCPLCGRPLVINYSKKTGNRFIGCSGFKEGCKYIKPGEGEEDRPQPVETEHKCPTCQRPMLERVGRNGPFLGCSGYPECTTTMKYDEEGKPIVTTQPTEHTCEKCGSAMVLRDGRWGPFLACTGYPKCKNAKDVDAQGNPIEPIDLGVKCDKCNSPMIIKKGPRGPFLSCSAYPKCRSSKPVPEEHKERLQEIYGVPAKKETPTIEVDEPCPECGGKMKLRQKRRGGGHFLGCSKYPRCKGTREATPEMLEALTESGAASSGATS